jgi:hypothetical protein
MAVACSVLIKEYTKAIGEGNATVFAGTDLLVPSGRLKLEGSAPPLCIQKVIRSSDKEHDHLFVSQFLSTSVNQNLGNNY